MRKAAERAHRPANRAAREGHSRPVHRFQCSCPTVSSSFTPSSMALVNLPTASHFCSLWGKNTRRCLLGSATECPASGARGETSLGSGAQTERNHRHCVLVSAPPPVKHFSLTERLYRTTQKRAISILLCFLLPSIPCECQVKLFQNEQNPHFLNILFRNIQSRAVPWNL